MLKGPVAQLGRAPEYKLFRKVWTKTWKSCNGEPFKQAGESRWSWVQNGL